MHLTVLPLPTFSEVLETHHETNGMSITLITVDEQCGKFDAHTVFRIFLATGKTRCIGRELSILRARSLAKRESTYDGNPV